MAIRKEEAGPLTDDEARIFEKVEKHLDRWLDQNYSAKDGHPIEYWVGHLEGDVLAKGESMPSRVLAHVAKEYGSESNGWKVELRRDGETGGIICVVFS